jgi:hypothetical protein
VYLSGVRRLLRLFDPESEKIPEGGKWLMSGILEKKVKALPLNKRRHLTSIGYIASKAYGLKESNKWQDLMLADVARYQKERNKHKRSDYEEKNLPDSMKDVEKAAKEYGRRIKRIYKKVNPTLADLYKVQKWLVLRLITELPFRNDLPTINVKEKKGNYLDKAGKKGLIIVMTEFKASDKVGPRTVKLSRGVVQVLKKFLKYRDAAGVEHDFLLSARNGNKMTKKGFSQMVIKTTEELLSKRVGSRIMRVLTATENKDIIEKASELTNKLLHTAEQTKQYVRK